MKLEDNKKFKIDPETGCWKWQGAKNSSGYAVIRINKKLYLAHRIYYELLKGEIPEGHQLDHLCRHRDCINVGHLEPVTCTTNIQRSSVAKITMDSARQIRKLYESGSFRYIDLAKKYGLSEDHIANIVKHRAWREGEAFYSRKFLKEQPRKG